MSMSIAIVLSSVYSSYVYRCTCVLCEKENKSDSITDRLLDLKTRLGRDMRCESVAHSAGTRPVVALLSRHVHTYACYLCLFVYILYIHMHLRCVSLYACPRMSTYLQGQSTRTLTMRTDTEIWKRTSIQTHSHTKTQTDLQTEIYTDG